MHHHGTDGRWHMSCSIKLVLSLIFEYYIVTCISNQIPLYSTRCNYLFMPNYVNDLTMQQILACLQSPIAFSLWMLSKANNRIRHPLWAINVNHMVKQCVPFHHFFRHSKKLFVWNINLFVWNTSLSVWNVKRKFPHCLNCPFCQTCVKLNALTQ